MSVILTGSSSGIGIAITNRLIEKNFHVIGLSRRHAEKRTNFEAVPCDLKQLDKLPQIARHIRDKFGTPRAIICNAGYGHFGHLEQLSHAAMRNLLHVNFLSHAMLIKEFLPSMKAQEFGNLIFIGSEAALKGKKMGSLYSASKFALRGFAQSLREECRQSHIHVSSIQPGMVRTPFYDALDFGPGEDETHALLPEDVAESVALILKMRMGSVCEEITLSPLKHVIKKQVDIVKNTAQRYL